MAQDAYLLMFTKGREDGGASITEGIQLAVALQAVGRKVSIFLTLGGTRWAYKGTAVDLVENNKISIEEYFQQFEELGGELLVCTPCLKAYCSIPALDEESHKRSLRANARYVGLAKVSELLFQMDATVF